MTIYAFLDADGYVVSTVSSSIKQEGAVIIDAPLEESPGVYYQYHLATKQWVNTATQQQSYDLAAQNATMKRNNLLYESDWTQIPNNPLTYQKQQEWAVYRQELRDITMQPDYPFTINWPTQPE